MPLTRTSFLRLIKICAAILIASIIIGYAIWRSLNYARGPHIEIFEPKDGSATTTNTITVRGRSERINNLTLNGNAVFIDEQGNFSEVIILFPGINRLTVAGRDQFGRSTETRLEIVGKGVLPEAKIRAIPIQNEKVATTSQ